MNPERILKRLVLPLAGIILFIIVVAAIASGGGGNDTANVTPISTGTSSGPAVISKAGFIRQADPICAQANSALGDLGTSATGTTPSAESVTAQQLRVIREELDNIQAQGTPASDTSDLNHFLHALSAEVKALDEKKLAIKRGDDAGVQTADSALASAQTDAEAAAKAFGFKDCGQPSASNTTPPTVAPTTSTPSVTTTTPVAPTTTTPPATTPAPPSTTGGGTGGSGGIGPGG
jgi:hypothetical protein